MRWRRFGAAVLTGAILVTCRGPAPTSSNRIASVPEPARVPPAGSRPAADVIRAAAAYRAMVATFGLGPGRHPIDATDDPRPAPAWAYSQALAATLAMARIPGVPGPSTGDVRRAVDGLRAYWNEAGPVPGYAAIALPPIGRASWRYHDDNLWIGLDLLDAYRLTGDRWALRRAQQVFDFVVSGWDADRTHPCSGGVFWTERPDNHDRNTVSNAPAAELGAQLSQLTGNATDLAWAVRMYGWVQRCLAAPDGLFWDHLDLTGAVDRTEWSYNQGTMIGASVALAGATGDPSYVATARRIADAALNRFGPPDRARREPPEYMAIFYSNLMLLAAMDRDPRYRAAMRSYGELLWSVAQPMRPGLFVADDRGPNLLEQAGAVRLFATIAGGAPTPV